MVSAGDIIALLGMKPLPGEGGYYVETYRAEQVLARGSLPPAYASDKHLATAIFYLLTPDTCSILHRLPTDEIYHFYLGDPVNMLQLLPDGRSLTLTLGTDVLNGQHVQAVVPKGTWQGLLLREGGSFALMGTTMAPGFDFSDFEAGPRESLLQGYPEQRDLIIRLTPSK